MTAREMIEQECQGLQGLSTYNHLVWDEPYPLKTLVFAAERVIDRLMRERDAEVERLRWLMKRAIEQHDDPTGTQDDIMLVDEFRAALGEVQP